MPPPPPAARGDPLAAGACAGAGGSRGVRVSAASAPPPAGAEGLNEASAGARRAAWAAARRQLGVAAKCATRDRAPALSLGATAFWVAAPGGWRVRAAGSGARGPLRAPDAWVKHHSRVGRPNRTGTDTGRAARSGTGDAPRRRGAAPARQPRRSAGEAGRVPTRPSQPVAQATPAHAGGTQGEPGRSAAVGQPASHQQPRSGASFGRGRPRAPRSPFFFARGSLLQRGIHPHAFRPRVSGSWCAGGRLSAAAHAPAAVMRALGGALGRSVPWRCPVRKCAARRLAVPASSAPAAPDGYDTPSEAFTVETVVKASRFIATVAPASSPEQALAFVAKHRDPEARHNCWAYRCGDQFRFNDDGEPSGTAGRPVLAALEASGLDRAVVLVVRFFGGVKLGAGGLTRGASRLQSMSPHVLGVLSRPATQRTAAQRRRACVPRRARACGRSLWRARCARLLSAVLYMPPWTQQARRGCRRSTLQTARRSQSRCVCLPRALRRWIRRWQTPPQAGCGWRRRPTTPTGHDAEHANGTFSGVLSLGCSGQGCTKGAIGRPSLPR